MDDGRREWRAPARSAKRNTWLLWGAIAVVLGLVAVVVARRGSPPDPTPGCEGRDVGAAELASAAREPGAQLCLGEMDVTLREPVQPAAGVTLDGLGVRRTVLRAGPGVRAVIGYDGVPDVTVKDLRVTGASGIGRQDDGSTAWKKQGRGIWAGPGTLIENVEADHNDQSGIGGGFTGLLVAVNLHHNGSNKYLGCCSAGVKSGMAYTIRGSSVHDNTGNGIWCDVVCKGGVMTVVGNVVESNTHDGIRLERSSRGPVQARVSDNAVRDSGRDAIAVIAFQVAHLSGNEVDGPIRFSDTPRGNSAGSVDARGPQVEGCVQPDVRCAGE